MSYKVIINDEAQCAPLSRRVFPNETAALAAVRGHFGKWEHKARTAEGALVLRYPAYPTDEGMDRTTVVIERVELTDAELVLKMQGVK